MGIRQVDALRKDLIEKITELIESRCQGWKRAEFSNQSVYREQFYLFPDSILLETLCEFLDGLDGIIPLRIVD